MTKRLSRLREVAKSVLWDWVVPAIFYQILWLIPAGAFWLVRVTLGKTWAWVLLGLGVVILAFWFQIKEENDLKAKIDEAMKHGGIDTRPPKLPEHHAPHVHVHHPPNISPK